MADQVNRIILEADDGPAVEAAGRANAALDRVEKTAARASAAATAAVTVESRRVLTASESAFAAYDRLAEKVERFGALVEQSAIKTVRAFDQLSDTAKGVGAAALSLLAFGEVAVKTTYAVIQNKQRIEELVTGYRALRIALSPTVFTAATIAVGLLAEQTVKLIYHRGELLDQQASMAAKMSVELDDAQRLYAATTTGAGGYEHQAAALGKVAKALSSDDASKIRELGVATKNYAGENRSALNVLADVGAAIEALQDPVAKTKAAYDIFGSELADKVLPRLNTRLHDSIDTIQMFGGVFNSSDVKNIQAFKADVDATGRSFDSLTQSVKAWASSMLNNFAAAVAEGQQGLKSLQGVRPGQTRGGTGSLLVDPVNGFSFFDLIRFTEDERQAILKDRRPAAADTGPASRELFIKQIQGRFAEESATIEFARKKVAEFEQEKEKALKTINDEQKNPDTDKRFKAALSVVDADRRLGEARGVLAQLEAMKKAQEEVNRAEQKTSEFRKQATLQELDGMERVEERRKQLLESDGKSAIARANIEAGIASERAKVQETIDKDLQKSFNAQLILQERDSREAAGRLLAIQTEESSSILKAREETRKTGLDIDLQTLESSKDLQLKALDLVSANTLASKIAVEQKKLEIEKEFLIKSFALKQGDLELKGKLEELTTSPGEERDARLQALAAQARLLESKTTAAIAAAEQQGQIKATQAVKDQVQRTFDAIKHSADGVFDALLFHVHTLGDALKAALLTPLLSIGKEILSSAVALPLTRLITGQNVGFQPGAGGSGPLGALGGLLGSLGVGGNLAFGGVSIPGGPGGTTGFNGPVNLTGLAGALGGIPGGFPSTIGGGSPQSRTGGLGGLAATALGLRSLFFNSGSIALGGGAATTAGGIGGILGNLAGIATSPAAGVLGAVTAALSIRKGGLTGILGGAAGGALAGLALGAQIGAIGGPLGLAIGAGVGAIAGIIRSFIKGSEEKIQSKVKALYGVSISKSFATNPLLGIIKETYGGDIDLGIRSQQIRDLIELYAMSTGQSSGPLVNRPRPFSLTQSGGAVSSASYYNGSTISASTLALPPSQPPQVIVQGLQVIVDGKGASAFMDGRVVSVISSNPGVVAAANLSANDRNIGRRAIAAQQLAPGIVTS